MSSESRSSRASIAKPPAGPGPVDTAPRGPRGQHGGASDHHPRRAAGRGEGGDRGGVPGLFATEDRRRGPEARLDTLALKEQLGLDLPGRDGKAQAVVGCRAERLHASGLDEASELRQTPGGERRQLIEERPGEREGKGEARVPIEEPPEQRRAGP